MNQNVPMSKKINNITSSSLLNRQVSAKEVAKSASFFDLEESSFMTRQIINVNDGLYF